MQLLLLALFLGRETAVGPGGKFLLKLINPSGCVHILELACVKRMTLIANVDLQLRSDAAGREGVTATAGYGCVLVIRMDAVFHGSVVVLSR